MIRKLREVTELERSKIESSGALKLQREEPHANFLKVLDFIRERKGVKDI